MTRQDATEVLMSERDRGVFLVRDSNSIAGDFVLCVRKDTKVSNYIINKIQQQDQTFYRIGDQLFENLPKLLTFYTLHYLDTTPLRRPAPKKPEKVISRYDFEGSDQDDLPFRRGEILTIIRKDEDQWWTAKNQQGQIGQIPVPKTIVYPSKASDPLLKAEREPERLKEFGIWPFQNSWYFGPMTRQDATEVLMSERDRGVFLVRDSNSIAGDFVLCVREDAKVSNYIINKIQQQDQTFYRIGDQLFENLPKLLTFYTLHYLDTTPLRRPAPKKPEKVISRYDFEGSESGNA
ncbi:unnamed protein product [Ceratitis capitata]|uniref:(Mediterranean fruit fly) hypothetical protein n=1 Tax=Ceratitis capitata TaxID=7213 RepID=A0A811UTA3_CERCA|nr:unnamed protein product [Ceratitis capitata]